MLKFKDTYNAKYRVPVPHVEFWYYTRNQGTDDCGITLSMKSGQNISTTVDVDTLIEIEEALGVKRLTD